MTSKNTNGGAKCIMREAVGYSRKGLQENLLVSGIWSRTIRWQGFEHKKISKHDLPPAHKKFTPYKPPGMLSQLPALRHDYKAKNAAGGRKCPSSYIGAAHKHIPHSEHVSIRFTIADDRIAMRPQLYGD